MTSQRFQWPNGKRAAVSLTFDDGRESQLDCAIPLLDAWGVQASFYISPAGVRSRIEDWKRAMASGHEIGNHTVSHPCSGNFPFSRCNALEDYTLERIEQEIVEANAFIETAFGSRPQTFAYPCGERFVGRGEGTQSYVPIVAKHFLVGRGFGEWGINDPACCDLAKARSQEMDGVSFENLKPAVAQAVQYGGWLILTGHDAGPSGAQTTRTDALEALCRHMAEPGQGLWVDTVRAIGSYIQQARSR